MFDELSAKLTATLAKLTGRGVLTEEAVKEGLREVRRVLLEADVSFELTREFLERVQAKAVGVSGAQGGAPRPAARQDRLRRAGRAARREAGADRLRLGAADDHPDGRAPGLRQDDHRRQAGQAAQAGAEGAVPGRGRRLSSGRRRPARDAGAAGGRRRVHGEPGATDVVGDRAARASRRRARRGRAPSSSTPPAGCRSTTR